METSAPKSTVAVIIVNYGTADLAALAVQSVLDRSHDGHSVEVHLLDNASPGGDGAVLERIHAERHWADRGVTLWLERENHGFGRANNVVIQAVSARANPPDHIFLLNPDAELDNEAIAILADTLDENLAIVAVGASINRPDMGSVAAAFRFPTALTEFVQTVGFGPLTRMVPSSEIALPGNTPRMRVDWVSGAAVMMRLSAVRAVGFFDPDFFLYYEETELMWRLNQAGGQIWYIPEAKVIHLEGAATQMDGGKRINKPQPAYWYDSWRLYHQKTQGAGAARRTALAKYFGGWLHVALRKVRGKSSNLPLAFNRDFRVHVLCPLFRGTGLNKDADGNVATASAQSDALQPIGNRNGNPSDIGFWALVAEDFRTHGRDWGSQGFWTLFWHRFGNWRMSVRPRIFRIPLTVLYRTMFKACEIFCGIMLPYNMPVGRRVKLEHFGGMVFSARSIGSDVILRQNTTLGISGLSDLNAKPTICDGVQVGAGAVIVGNITIGAGAIVGANAVVVRDVAPGDVVGGIPAKVIRRAAQPVQDA